MTINTNANRIQWAARQTKGCAKRTFEAHFTNLTAEQCIAILRAAAALDIPQDR